VDSDNNIIFLNTMSSRRDVLPSTRNLTAMGFISVYSGEEANKIDVKEKSNR